MSFKNKFKNLFLILIYLVRHPARFWRALGKEWRFDLHDGGRTSKLKKIARWCWATLPRRIVSTILIATFIITPISFLIFKKEAKAAWWNDSWQYRQKIQLTNSTGADLEDFQVSTTVDTAALITDGKMQATTCADMRFTDSKGQQLNYWIEGGAPGCNNASTEVWVKVPKVYNGTNATSIYMYYGNPQAAATQDGDKVFDFFDNFSVVDTNEWQDITGTNTIVSEGYDSSALQTSGDENDIRFFSNSTFSGGYALKARMKENSTDGGLFFDAQDASNGYLITSRRTGGTSAFQWYKRVTGGWTALSSHNSVSSWTDSEYRTLEISRVGSAISVRDNESSLSYTTSTDSTYSSGKIGIRGNSQQTIDWIFVRKSVSADPTSSASAEEVGPGPVAYWKFDEGQGSTAQDSTVNGNNGALQNSPTWKQDSDCVSGKCLEFDGLYDASSQYISVDDDDAVLDFDATKEYTWSTWINYSGFPVGHTTQCFLSKDAPPASKSNGFNFCLRQDGSVADLFVNNGSGSSNDLDVNLKTNSWINIIVVYDGSSNWEIYVNGDYKGVLSFAAPSDTSAKYFIGAGCTTGTGELQVPAYFFQGKIDSVKIFPYQRSADQIQQDYNAGKAGNSSPEGANVTVGESPKWMTDGLVGHWKMDESSGTVVADASGNGNTGTLTNAQETGTSDASENTVTTMVDTDGSLSTTNDAYNNMILRFTAACGSIASGTERTITDYTGTPHTFTVATLADIPNSCAYEVRHQTGGKFGNGLGFEGNNDYITAGTAPSLTMGANMTLSFWMNAKPAGSYYEGVISKTNRQNGWQLLRNGTGTSLFFEIFENGNNSGSGYGASYTTTNQWDYITLVIEEKSWKIYKNGTRFGSFTSSRNLTNQAVDLWLGRGNVNGGYLTGNLDDVRVYNRALSPDEVRALSEYGPGPVGWWKMDEGSGDTVYDSSGNGNNGTWSSSTGKNWDNGKYGNALNFDGSSKQVSLSTSSIFDFNSAMTMEAWVKPATHPGAYRGVFSRYTHYQIVTSQGSEDYYKIGLQVGGSWRGTEGVVPVDKNVWQHIAFTYDKNTKTIFVYKNGTLATSVVLSGLSYYDINKITTGIYFGVRDGPGAGNYFNGLVDDARLYNYARTSKQITEDMNAGHPIGGSPVGSAQVHLKFDEGQGGTANNSGNGGSAQNGTMTPQSGGQTQTYEMWSSGGKWNRAADLDGTDDYISIPDFSY